jgi:hypothetical protein
MGIIPKKNGTVTLISDFRKLNEQLKRKPYSIPKIAQHVAGIRGVCVCNLFAFEHGILHH